MNRIVFGIVGIIFLIVGLLTYKISGENEGLSFDAYSIEEKWELPEELNEISGITWLGNDLLACVQDEDGIVFIYNLKSSQIVDRIEFGESGDYEDINLFNEKLYVLRSDGLVFEISSYKQNPQVQKYVTPANKISGINLEGLSANPDGNILLMAVKERKDADDRKEVFSFKPGSKKQSSEAFFSINLEDPIFKDLKGRTKNRFSPGAIELHPKDGKIYILDGTRPKLLITNSAGKALKLLKLDSKDFQNPEGLSFSSDGDIYISNEAEGKPANILKISINEK
ncbi:SdiA-regulated domain-containing protein [Salegentibacter sediminis]|uniref:SdiA-regulated domain-containing protein n=1 Tax=Salegentibacter sediminis TaxID=1930251 RepID=UPI0009C14206|nr:SdiA-regulated domain-containing protein [Salegentibacter sediminis]